jgi:hypothetical protein
MTEVVKIPVIDYQESETRLLREQMIHYPACSNTFDKIGNVVRVLTTF